MRLDGVLGSSGISWTICKQCAPHFRQITTPTPHHYFYRPDALSDAQPTASKYWRQQHGRYKCYLDGRQCRLSLMMTMMLFRYVTRRFVVGLRGDSLQWGELSTQMPRFIRSCQVALVVVLLEGAWQQAGGLLSDTDKTYLVPVDTLSMPVLYVFVSLTFRCDMMQ